MKKIISIPGAPPPIGPYSQAILKENTLFVSGQIPLDPATGELKVASVEEATHRVMKNIQTLLESAEMKMSDVVKCSIFLKSMDDFPTVNTIYASYFEGDFPARETVQVAKLPLDVPVEISCIAIR